MNVLPSAPARYEPFPWVFWVRVAQLALTVISIALTGFATSKSYLAVGFGFSFFVYAWTLVWLGVSGWALYRLPQMYKPNIVALVLEGLSWFWWLITLAMLATLAVAASLWDRTLDYVDGLGGFNSDYVDTAYYGLYNDIRTASACVKVVTALAAVNFVLFVASFVAACMKMHRQRKSAPRAIHHHGTTELGQVAPLVSSNENKESMRVQAH